LKHRDAPIPVLSADRIDAPPQLEAIFQRMVAKHPDDRFPAMTDVVRTFEELKRAVRLGDTRPAVRPSGASDDPTLAGQPVAAGPEVDTGRVERPASTGVFLPESGAGRVAGRTVVLAEPSRTQAGIVRRYLGELGINTVHTTGSGREAVELAKRHRAGVIIAAMHLADMTGAQLARGVLADPDCDGIGFILATSETDSRESGTIPDSPRVDLVQKPFDPQRLSQSIASVAG